MKKYIFLLIVIVIPMFISCSSTRDVSERRSLMMPRLSEVPKNAGKYKDLNYSKRNKYQKKMYKKRITYGK